MSKDGAFWFRVTPKGEALCWAIVDRMCEIFSIDKEESLLRINDYWGSRDGSWSADFNDGFGNDPNNDIRFHETPEYWAKRIYYGPDVLWWREDESKLKPFPLPEQ